MLHDLCACSTTQESGIPPLLFEFAKPSENPDEAPKADILQLALLRRGRWIVDCVKLIAVSVLVATLVVATAVYVIEEVLGMEFR